MAAGEDVEVAGFEFEDDGAGDAGFFAGCGPDLLGEAEDDGFGVGEGEIALEGVFGGDGFGGSVGNDGAVVDAAGEFVEANTVTAEAGFEGGEFAGSQIAYGVDVEVLKDFFCDLADAWDAADWQRREEGIDLVGLYDEEAVGLAPVGGDLGEKFVGRYSGGGGEVEVLRGSVGEWRWLRVLLWGDSSCFR